MKPSSHTVLLVVFFLFLSLHFITSSFSFPINTTSAHLCSYDQSHALLDFKNSFSINSKASMNRVLINFYYIDQVLPGQCSPLSHPKTNSWQEGQDCCYWDGVTCDITTGEVIGLDLSCSWLQGQLSSNSSLFLLQHLHILNLAYNDFIGSEIPPKISQFQRLTHLNLSNSYIQGEVPIEISYLSNLVSLDLAFSYDLKLPRLTMTRLVQNLTMLKELHLGRVDSSLVEPDCLRNISSSLTSLALSRLKGNFPTSIFHLPNLQLLYLSGLSNWDLQVSLPSSNWSTTSLTGLGFSAVYFKNGLPSSICKLKSLKFLSIDSSNITGSIPDSIGNITNLEYLSLDTNYLFGTIPPSIAYLIHLKYLGLGFNNLVGSIPNFSNLSLLHTIDLGWNSLSGTIPFYMHFLSSLRNLGLSSNLTHLEYLDLSFNKLVGTIPLFLAYLTRLQHLDLSGNNLVGSIPNFSNLSLIHTIDLGWNSLNGTIPFYMYSLPLLRNLQLLSNLFIGGQLHPFQSRVVEYINLRGCGLDGSIPAILFPHGANQLTTLDFGRNSLNGTIPSSLFTLPSLLYLDLSYNQLVGGIPKFKSTSLQTIYLSNNRLQGNIPRSIFGLANLTILYFPSNNLSGTIDTSMFSKLQNLSDLDGSNNSLSYTTNMNLNHSLPNLEYFDFSSNNLTDFPVFLRGSKILSQLDLSDNKIDGHVPDWLLDVGRDTLNYLNLAHNNLIGIDKLPWTNLQYLDVRSNLLRGPLLLPTSTILVAYFISNNSLTGDVPTLICNTSTMEAFDLSRNYFSGTIPECLGNMYTLDVLDLSMNKLHGNIPNFAGQEKRSLRTLKLNGNQLEGKLPVSLVNCENLEVLDIGNNNINDTFPHWLRFIKELQVLVLKSNNFHGYIHDYEYQNSFQKLRIFDISDNNFVGSLPANYIKGLKAMKNDMLVGTKDSMYMESYVGGGSYYHDSISLTIKGSEIQLERILTTFTTIDFSKNKFGGEILQVFGTLISLKSLNLSRNNMFGPIPSSIGNLRNLESLDLSSNKIGGTIPTELASLTYLGVLNLSQNVLVGPIPSTNNFNTHFGNGSYQGNLALCGPPLSKKCGPEKSPPIIHEADDSDDDDFDRKIILYGYVFDLVIGLSIGYIVLSGELPIWFAKMVQRYGLRKLQGRTQLPRGRN